MVQYNCKLFELVIVTKSYNWLVGIIIIIDLKICNCTEMSVNKGKGLKETVKSWVVDRNTWKPKTVCILIDRIFVIQLILW